MYGYVLQDWITIRGASTTSTIIQNESDWMGFSSFQDIGFWIDVREFSTAGTLTLNLQTSPTKDEVLFQPLSNCSLTVAVTNPPPLLNGTALPKSILATNPGVPLSTWVRWSLSNSSGAWDITFRILAQANRSVAG